MFRKYQTYLIEEAFENITTDLRVSDKNLSFIAYLGRRSLTMTRLVADRMGKALVNYFKIQIQRRIEKHILGDSPISLPNDPKIPQKTLKFSKTACFKNKNRCLLLK